MATESPNGKQIQIDESRKGGGMGYVQAETIRVRSPRGGSKRPTQIIKVDGLCFF